jgi:hypothetical protein
MLPSDAFVVTIGNGINAGKYGSILIQGRGCNQILCAESSGLQIIGGKSFTNSFIATGFTEGSNLIAIKVRIMNDKGTSFIREAAFFLSIENKDKMLLVNTKENFLAFENGRVGLIDNKGYITTQIGKDIFTTNHEYEERHYFIGEKDVCCNYLAGHISADEVMKSAKFTQATRKFHQAQAIMFQKEIGTLKAENKRIKLHFKKIYEASKKETMDTLKELVTWKTTATALQEAITPLHYCPPHVISPFCFGKYRAEEKERNEKIRKALELFPQMNEGEEGELEI